MDGELVVAPERAARAAEIRRALAGLRSQAARTLWRLGALLREVDEERLYLADGAESFTAWLSQHEVAPLRTARRAIRIAAHFSEKVAGRFGSEKLDATVAWLDATSAEEQPGDLMLATVRVRGPGGTFRSVPYPQATASEIRQGTRLLLGARAGSGAPRDRQRALAASLGVPTRRLTVRAGEDGQRVTLRDATLAELRALVAALEAEG